LPIPEYRRNYSGSSMNHRFFVIEHYFSDEILRQNNMIGESIAPDSIIFRINGTSGKKDKFSNEISQLNISDFEHFKTLFNALNEMISSNKILNNDTE
jgi:hypothetical protein